MRKKLKAHEKDETKWYLMRFFIENYFLTEVLSFFSVHLPKLYFFYQKPKMHAINNAYLLIFIF
jgi:hypothetical protein